MPYVQCFLLFYSPVRRTDTFSMIQKIKELIVAF